MTEVFHFARLTKTGNRTWKVCSIQGLDQTCSRPGNETRQFSFASAAQVTSMVELSNSTGWDFESTIKFKVILRLNGRKILWMICLRFCGTDSLLAEVSHEACTKTRNNETKRPKRNHRNQRNENTETAETKPPKRPKQAKRPKRAKL